MTLFDLLILLFFYTIITFGNGAVMFPLLDKELVQIAQVINRDQLLYAFAISRITPGQANLYIAAIGYLTFGALGALLSSITIVLPSFLIIPMLHGYKKFQNISYVTHFVQGITITSIGLIFSATATIGQDVLNGQIQLCVFLGTILLAKGVKVNSFVACIVASIIGATLYFI
jgi:chromate transporter